MNAARAVLDDLAMIGATVEVARDRLILRAGLTAIPATLVSRVREAKADLMATLVVRRDRTEVQQKRIGNPPRPQPTKPSRPILLIGWTSIRRHPHPGAVHDVAGPNRSAPLSCHSGPSREPTPGFTPNAGRVGIRRGGPKPLRPCRQ